MKREPTRRPRRGRLVSAGDALAELARDLPGTGSRDLAWRRACGARLAARTKVLSLEAGVLTVAVPDSAWALHLGRISRDLLGRVRARLREPVSRLSFEVRPEVLDRVAPPRRPERPDPGPEVRAVVRRAGVTRPALADAVARAMAAHTAPSDPEDRETS